MVQNEINLPHKPNSRFLSNSMM